MTHRFLARCSGLDVVATEEVAEQGVRVAMLPIGETRFELLDRLARLRRLLSFLESAEQGFIILRAR